MVRDSKVSAVLVSTDLQRAQRFYEDKVGLKLSPETVNNHLVFECGDGTSLLIYGRPSGNKADHTQARFWSGGSTGTWRFSPRTGSSSRSTTPGPSEPSTTSSPLPASAVLLVQRPRRQHDHPGGSYTSGRLRRGDATTRSRCVFRAVAGECSRPAWLWEVVSIEVGGEVVTDHPAIGSSQRIEQCGDRLVVTAAGIIHDMRRADGTLEHGVHDDANRLHDAGERRRHIRERRTRTPPRRAPDRGCRRRDGDQMVWDYLGFTAKGSIV